MKRNLLIVTAIFICTGCAVVQSAVKSTFPYTATVLIPQSSKVGASQSVTGMATSFDQRVTKNGNNGDRIKDVHVVSAKLQSKDPSDFNIGNLTSVKVYASKADGSNEVLVASRSDITPGAGDSIVLDIDNSNALDEQVNGTQLQIRVVYMLRNHIDVNANLRVVLGLRANPGK